MTQWIRKSQVLAQNKHISVTMTTTLFDVHKTDSNLSKFTVSRDLSLKCNTPCFIGYRVYYNKLCRGEGRWGLSSLVHERLHINLRLVSKQSCTSHEEPTLTREHRSLCINTVKFHWVNFSCFLPGFLGGF